MVLVIGVGNEVRGDDGVGLRVARRIRDAAPEAVRVAEAADPIELIEIWKGAADVIVIDATQNGLPPGSVSEVHVGGESSAGVSLGPPAHSSHGFGLAGAVALTRALGELPSRLVVYGIEGASFAHGAPMSAQVAAAADALADRLIDAFRTGAEFFTAESRG